MALPYFHLDAFTGTMFGGNQAGVCVLADWLPTETLQRIAAEHNIAETAFFVHRDAHYELRWFTPALEIDLCGHATLASAHVLFNHLGLGGSSVAFQTRSGLLTVHRDGDRLTLDFPSRPAEPCSPPPALLEGLGAQPTFVGKSRDYLAVFETEERIRTLRPDMALLETVDALGVIVTAPGNDCDFVSRFFAPRAGVPEDPATGSAHCTLSPYWSKRLGKTTLEARQLSARGAEISCEQRGDRVFLTGRAVTYLTGFIHL
jgi:PhzF family phenazine biosynthesis protein